MGAAGCCEARPRGHIRPNLPMSSLSGKADGKMSAGCVATVVCFAIGVDFVAVGFCFLMLCRAERSSLALLNAACRRTICCCDDVGLRWCLFLRCVLAAVVTSFLVCCCMEYVAFFHMVSCCIVVLLAGSCPSGRVGSIVMPSYQLH